MQKEIKVEFKYNKTVVICLIIIAICVLSLLFIKESSSKILLALCAIFFLLNLLRLIYRRLFNNKPALLINNIGIYYYNDVGNETWINWTDILKITTETVNGIKQLRIETNSKQHTFAGAGMAITVDDFLNYIKSFPHSGKIAFIEEQAKTKLNVFKIKYRHIFTDLIGPMVFFILLLKFGAQLSDIQKYFCFIAALIIIIPLNWFFDPPKTIVKGRFAFKYYFFGVMVIFLLAISVKCLFPKMAWLPSLIIVVVAWMIIDILATNKYANLLGLKDLNKDSDS